MKTQTLLEQIGSRRGFFQKLGVATATVTAATAQTASAPFQFDNPTQILTAALIAEDLATTFYYNALAGPAGQDPKLTEDPLDRNYLRAALRQEIEHANLLRSLLGISGPMADPV